MASAIGEGFKTVLVWLFENIIAPFFQGMVDGAVGFFNAIYTIFDTLFGWIGDIISAIGEIGIKILTLTKYINPFDTENFIGYKIIELLGNLLKSLFIPEDGYFENEFNEVKSKLNNKIPYETYLSALNEIGSVPVAVDERDVSIALENYKISDNLTINLNNFIDFGIFTKYKNTWYGWCRAVIYPLLIFYWLNQISKFLNHYSVSDFQTTGGGGKK